MDTCKFVSIYICMYINSYSYIQVITKAMCHYPDYHHNGFDNVYISKYIYI